MKANDPRRKNLRPGPGPGRPKGSPNRATREVRALAQRLVLDPQYQAALWRRLCRGRAGPLEPLLWKYAFGEPRPREDAPRDPCAVDLSHYTTEELEAILSGPAV